MKQDTAQAQDTGIRTLAITPLSTEQKTLATTLWCGIAALSLITGRNTQDSRDTIAKAIKDGLGKRNRKIKGIYDDELIEALAYLGYEVNKIYSRGVFTGSNKVTHSGMSLARFLHGFKPAKGAIYLIVIPKHYMVYDGVTLADNTYHGTVMNCKKADEECRIVYEVTEVNLDDMDGCETGRIGGSSDKERIV